LPEPVKEYLFAALFFVFIFGICHLSIKKIIKDLTQRRKGAEIAEEN
jgi:hypothetical protein